MTVPTSTVLALALGLGAFGSADAARPTILDQRTRRTDTQLYFSFVVICDDYANPEQSASVVRRLADLFDRHRLPAEFVISAPFSTWQRVIEGKLDPIQGMMMGRLKLKGDLRKIMRYPRAAKEIVSCCAYVPTHWS